MTGLYLYVAVPLNWGMKLINHPTSLFIFSITRMKLFLACLRPFRSQFVKNLVGFTHLCTYISEPMRDWRVRFVIFLLFRTFVHFSKISLALPSGILMVAFLAFTMTPRQLHSSQGSTNFLALTGKCRNLAFLTGNYNQHCPRQST